MPNLESSEVARLRLFLEARNIRFVSQIRANRSGPNDLSLYVSEDDFRGQGGRQVTSRRQLDKLKEEIFDALKLEIEWVITPGTKIDTIEAGLKALVEAQFPNVVAAVYVSPLDLVPFSVFVDLTANGALNAVQPELRAVVARFVSNLGFAEPVVVLSNELPLPTTPAILRRLKVIAPANVETLFNALGDAKFSLPSIRWLQGHLDSLRKHSFVIRFHDGRYVLTESGLRQIPQSRKRSSSDIERALALGRRRW